MRIRLSLVLLFLLYSSTRAFAYPCFYELNAPTRQGDGQQLLSGHVDAAAGAFINHFECLSVPGAMPLQGAIFYTTQDNSSGPFGIGTSCPYDWFIQTSVAWPGSPYVLIAPGNRHYVFDTNSSGIYKDTRDPSLLGATLSFTSQPSGVLCTLTWKDGRKFRFDSSGGLVSVVDRFSSTVTITRNQVTGFVATVWLGGNTNRFLRFLPDSGGHRIVKIQAQYSYTGSLRTWTLAYDPTWAKLVALTDPLNQVYSFAYTSYTRSDNVTLSLLSTVTDPRPMTPISVHYDASGRVSSTDAPGGGTNSYTYSAAIGADGTTTGVDPAGDSTTFAYTWNPSHHSYQITRLTDNTKSESLTIERNASPTYLPTAMVDYRNRRDAYTWDTASGDLLTVTHPTVAGGTAAHTIGYDPTYHIRTSLADPLGRHYAWAVDGSGKVTSYTNPAGEVTTFTYNAQGQLLTVTDPLSHVSTWTRDTYGIPLTFTDPGGHTSSFTRNDIGLVLRKTDATGINTDYQYDVLNRLTGVWQTVNFVQINSMAYTYDAAGHQTQATDSLGNIWKWEYDCRGNFTKETNPLNQVRTWNWTNTAYPQSYTDFAGNRMEYAYLADGRLSAANFRQPGGTLESSITYAYDSTSHLLASCTDSTSGTCTYQRDILDQLTTYSSPNGSISYQYDLCGRRTQTQVAGQNPITYTYNSRSNVASVTQSGQTTTFSYDAAGRLIGQTLPNGVTTARVFDAAGLTQSVSSTKSNVTLDSTAYTRDAAGAITSITANGVTQNVGYDSLKRVTSIADPTNNYSFSYNNQGLRTQQVLNGSTTTYSYDKPGRLTAVNAAPIIRNANGYPTSYSGRSYTFDVRGRLTNYGVSGSTYSFTYDPEGNQLVRTANGVTTRVLYSGRRPVQESSGGVITNVLLGPTMGPPLKYGGNYPLPNGHGSVTKITDGTGAVVGGYTYDPFGLATHQGTTASPYQFQSGATTHPTLVRVGRVEYSPEWGQPVGGIGIAPSRPRLPNAAGTTTIPLTGLHIFADDIENGGSGTPPKNEIDPGGELSDVQDCQGAPPCTEEGGGAPAGESAGGGSWFQAPPSRSHGTEAVNQLPIALGPARPTGECTPAHRITEEIADMTGSIGDPFHEYGIAQLPAWQRCPTAIEMAPEINFNLDGWKPILPAVPFHEGMQSGFTNAEYQMCMTPQIFPKVTWWRCGAPTNHFVPDPQEPYTPNPEGTAGEFIDTHGGS